MRGTGSIAKALLATCALGFAACSTLDVEDYCRYSQNQSIRDADPESLLLVLGVKPDRSLGSPFIVFRSLADNGPGASLRLSASSATDPPGMNPDQSRCAGVDWRSYELTVDREHWNAFWSDEDTSHFEMGIAFLDDSQPMLMGDFGAAILDRASGGKLVACGCYWK
jgi:hypothetical protein